MSSLQRRIESLERVRRGSAVPTAPPLTPSERVAALVAIRAQVAFEDYTPACRDALLAWIDRAVNEIRQQQAMEVTDNE